MRIQDPESFLHWIRSEGELMVALGVNSLFKGHKGHSRTDLLQTEEQLTEPQLLAGLTAQAAQHRVESLHPHTLLRRGQLKRRKDGQLRMRAAITRHVQQL
jgi:hypothetical protein